MRVTDERWRELDSDLAKADHRTDVWLTSKESIEAIRKFVRGVVQDEDDDQQEDAEIEEHLRRSRPCVSCGAIPGLWHHAAGCVFDVKSKLDERRRAFSANVAHVRPSGIELNEDGVPTGRVVRMRPDGLWEIDPTVPGRVCPG